MNRLTAISQQVGGNVVSSHTYTYNQADQRTRATREDGAYWDYSYDALGQVIGGIKKTAAGQAIPGMSFGYSYDDIGNRKTSTTGVPSHESAYTANLLNQYTQRTVPGYFDLLGSANPAATVSVTSPADSASPAAVHATTRLGAAWHAAVPVSNSAAAVRQSLKVTGVLKGQGAAGKDIVAEQTGNLFVPQTPEAFTYDDDGNLLTDGRWNYTWDGENRLVAMETLATLPATVTRQRLVFAYDAQARRVSKQVYNWTNGAWALQAETRFLYDGWNLIAEFAVDQTTQARTLKTAYVWGLDLSGSPQNAGGIGGLLASTTVATGATNYFCYDGNGNVTTLVNVDTGTTCATYEYDPFGNTLAQVGTMAVTNPFWFNTKYIDSEMGLLYYGYRYYNSAIGRWLSRDLIGEAGGDNIYAFVINDSVDLIDPLGLDFIAVGIRLAKAAMNLQNHMSIEFYEEKPPCTKKGYRFTPSDIGKAPLQYAKRTDQFELIPTFSDYEHRYSKTILGKTIDWSLPARVSFIHRTSTANKLAVIYDDKAGDAAVKWKEIIAAAWGYSYAEQLPIGNPVKNWPNSKYQLPPGNNSNTFIHEMASVIGASAVVFPSTPGATKASGVTDDGPVPVYKTAP